MSSLSFFVPGPAVPERKRNVRRPGFNRTIDTPKANDYKARVYSQAAAAMAGKPPLEGPVVLTLCVYRLRPKSLKKSVQYPITRPDCTNHTKLAEDALNGLVWRDDAQVVDQHISKRFGSVPGMQITVEVLE